MQLIWLSAKSNSSSLSNSTKEPSLIPLNWLWDKSLKKHKKKIERNFNYMFLLGVVSEMEAGHNSQSSWSEAGLIFYDRVKQSFKKF